MEARKGSENQLGNIRRIVAVSLLLVLLTGLSITTFTNGWLNFLPYHDHLIVGTRALGIVHHAHHGDALDHAHRAMQTVDPRSVMLHGHAHHAEVAVAAQGAVQPLNPTPGQIHDHGILSLQPLTAQPELNAFTALGWVDDVGTALADEVGIITGVATLTLAIGLRVAPPSPPPRFA